MHDSADRLTQSIENMARSKHDHANVVFLVSIAATIFFAGFALTGMHRSQYIEQARTRTEAELREVTALRRAILDSADYTIISTDVQGTIVTFNHAAERRLGYSAEEIVGKVSPGIFHDPAEVAARAEYLTKKLGRYVAPGFEVFTAEIKEGASDENEWTYLCKDGSSFPVRLSATALRDERGALTGYLGIAQDITERKKAEEAIRTSEARLRDAQRIAQIGSWERDYQTGTMSWSDEMFRLCGLEPGSITPSIEALTLHTHPLDRRRAQDCMKRAMQDGVGAELELRLVGADGTLRYVFIRTEILKEEAGRILGSRGTVTDVTERVQALQEQTKFVSLIENSSDFIAMATLDGVLVSMNPAGRALVGLEREGEVTTTMLPDFIPAEIWAIMRQEALPMVMRDDHWKGESQLINVLTGAVHDMQASLFLIRNPATGEPMCLATVQHDITEQKWMDLQLQQNLVIVQDQNVELEQQHELGLANAYLEALATTDGLTGAKNHRAFQEKLTEEFKRAERSLQAFSIILLDVDKFKQYNDTYGHPEGDRVLKEIVRVLKETARETDFVARYGGEEFIILLPDTGKVGATEAAERFRAAIEIQDWPLRPVTASFGVASLNAATKACQDLVALADKALYVSKAGGRNRVSHADIQAEPILSEL